MQLRNQIRKNILHKLHVFVTKLQLNQTHHKNLEFQIFILWQNKLSI